MYIELHCASAFSFLRGASLPETLVERAAALGYTALALLDADGVYGAPRFHKAAQQAGLKPIIGAELTIDKSHIPDTNTPIAIHKSQIANSASPKLRQDSPATCQSVARDPLRGGGHRGSFPSSWPRKRATGISAAWSRA